MILVVPDTNFLIYAIKHNINIDYELDRTLNSYRVVILDCVKNELEKLKNRLKGKEKYSINLILSLIKKYKLEKEYNIGKYADEIILNYVEYHKKNNNKVVVCTNDKELKNKLIERGIPVLVVKQKRYFELQGYL